MELIKFSLRYYFRWSAVWLFVGILAAVFAGVRALFPHYSPGDCPFGRIVSSWVELVFWGGFLPSVVGLWLIRLGEIREGKPIRWLFLWEGAAVLWQAALLWAVFSAAFGLRRTAFGWSWFDPVYGLFALSLLLVTAGTLLNFPYAPTPRHRLALYLFVLPMAGVQVLCWLFLSYREPPAFSEILFWGVVFNGVFLPLLGWLISFSRGAEYPSAPELLDYYLLSVGPWFLPLLPLSLLPEYSAGGWDFWPAMVLVAPLLVWMGWLVFKRRWEFFGGPGSEDDPSAREHRNLGLLLSGAIFSFAVLFLFLLEFYIFRGSGLYPTSQMFDAAFLLFAIGVLLFVWMAFSELFKRYFSPLPGAKTFLAFSAVSSLFLYLFLFIATSAQLALLELLAFIPQAFSGGKKLLFLSEIFLIYPAWMILWVVWKVYLELFSSGEAESYPREELDLFLDTDYYP